MLHSYQSTTVTSYFTVFFLLGRGTAALVVTAVSRWKRVLPWKRLCHERGTRLWLSLKNKDLPWKRPWYSTGIYTCVYTRLSCSRLRVRGVKVTLIHPSRQWSHAVVRCFLIVYRWCEFTWGCDTIFSWNNISSCLERGLGGFTWTKGGLDPVTGDRRNLVDQAKRSSLPWGHSALSSSVDWHQGDYGPSRGLCVTLLSCSLRK